MIIAVPLLINILAIFIWFLHWHGYWKSLNLKAFFLSFMTLSLFLWLQIKGLEFGAIYFFISTSIIGLLCLVESKHAFKEKFKRTKKRSSNKTEARKNETSDYKPPKIRVFKLIPLFMKSIINLLLLIVIPFITAASISVLLPTAFGVNQINILVFSLFIFLITWSLLLTWVYMKTQRTIALSLLSLTSIITISTIYISTSSFP